jgi:tellurite resistance protein
VERPPPLYLIDRRFQIKYTALLIIVAVTLLGGLGVVIWRESQVGVESARLAAAQAEKALVEAQTSARILRMNSADEKVDADLAALDKQNAAELVRARVRSAEIERSRDLLLALLIGAGIAVIAILGATGMYITRKIVEPVFHLKRMLRKVGTGRLVVKHVPDSSGELDDLFHTFVQMTHSLRALQAEWIETLDQAIAELPAEQTARLRELREQLGRGLGKIKERAPAPILSQSHPVIDTSVQALLSRFEAADYGILPIVDLGTLIANADGKIDEAERRLLRYLFQILLGTRMSPAMVHHLLGVSLEALGSADRDARARLIAEILLDCDAVEPGLTIALAVAFSSEGLSPEERRLIEIIADAGGVTRERLDQMIAEVQSWNIEKLIAPAIA